jgi:ribosomal protein S18 acetylase RimI-like enzyme
LESSDSSVRKGNTVTDIEYLDNLETVTAEQLQGFFVGWPNPPRPATHYRLLQGSDVVILARDTRSQAIVGFVTAISDGVLAAYIPLLEVLPAYQHQGIGTALMEHVLQRLSHLYAVDLLCDPELQPYYARLGMHPAAGMLLRNYGRQSGDR